MVWNATQLEQSLCLYEQRPRLDQLPLQIDLDGKWHNLIKELVDATEATDGIEHSVALITTDKIKGREGTPWPVEAEPNPSLLRDEVWGTHDLPLFVSETTLGAKTQAEFPEEPPAVEWEGRRYLTFTKGFIHTHPIYRPKLSIEDWISVLTSPYRFHMMAHREINYLIFPTISSMVKYFEMKTAIQARPQVPNLSRQQRKDFAILLHPKKARFWNKQKVFAWERRICALLHVGLYSGKPGGSLRRVG